MSFAWSAVAVLVLFLPGLLCYLGVSTTERFTRERVRGGTLGQFAVVLFVSFIVHGALFALLTRESVCATVPFVRCIDVELLLDAIFIAGGGGERQLIGDVAASLDSNALRIFTYMAAACGVAFLGGVVSGLAIVSGKGRAFAKHRWAYVLVPDESFSDFTRRLWKDLTGAAATGVETEYFANVVTRIRRDGNILVYRGEIRDYGVGENGCLSYVALMAPERCYMKLPLQLQARIDHNWHTIGTSQQSGSGPGSVSSGGEHIFLVDGDDIEHVVFTSVEMEKTEEHEELLKKHTSDQT